VSRAELAEVVVGMEIAKPQPLAFVEMAEVDEARWCIA
jgi:hypothetical protein